MKQNSQVSPFPEEQTKIQDNSVHDNSAVVLLDNRDAVSGGSAKTDTPVPKHGQADFAPSLTHDKQLDPQIQTQKSDLDPVKGLSWLRQIEANETIVNSVNTPFDYARYIQVIRNPLNDTELISVQIVKRNVFHSNCVTDQSDLLPEQLCCKNGHSLKLTQFISKVNRTCDFCTGQIDCKKEDLMVWTCRNDFTDEKEKVAEGCFTEICCSCYSKYFTRRQLEKKASEHSKFDAYCLSPQQQNDEHRKVDSKTCIVEHKTLHQLESESAEFKGDKKSTIVNYAQLTDHGDYTAVRFEKSHSEFAIVAFWKENKEEDAFVCFRQFKVTDPFVLENSEEPGGVVLGEFLHVGDNKEVFYFQEQKMNQKPSESVISISFIDMEKAIQGTDKLKVCEPSIYELPLCKEKTVLQKVVRELMIEIAKPTTKKDVIRKQLSLRCGLLVFTTKLAVEQVKGSLQDLKISKYEAKNYDEWNLVFIDIESLMPSFVIYGAYLLLKVSMQSGKQEIETKRFYNIWYMERGQLKNCQMSQFQSFPAAFKKDVAVNSSANRTTQYLCGDKFEQVKEKPNKNKMFDMNSFGDVPESIRTRIDPARIKAILDEGWKKNKIQGWMHSNDTRFTMIFQGNEWITFCIKDEVAYQIFGNDPSLQSFGSEFVKKGDKVQICTDFIHTNLKDSHQISESYNKWTCSLFDLDQAELEELQDSNDLRNWKGMKLQTYSTRIPKEFCPDQYNITKIRFTQFVQKGDGDNLTLSGAYFYKSQQTNQVGMIMSRYLNKVDVGHENLADQKMNDKLLQKEVGTHLCQIIREHQYQIDYPVIVYKSFQPQNNVLMVSNFAINEPQKLIDLGTSRFICFVDQNIPEDPVWRNKGESCIFFLVRTISGLVRLMYYRTFAWAKNKQLPDGHKANRQNNIQLVSGNITCTSKYDFSHVKKAILVVKNDNVNCAQLLLQGFNTVLIASFDQPLKISPPLTNIIQQEDSMAPLEMLSGKNSAFCLQRSRNTGDEILFLGFDKLQTTIQSQIVYAQKSPILSMQLKYSDYSPDSASDVGLYIIDVDYQFKLVQPSEQKLTLAKGFALTPKFETQVTINFAKHNIDSLLKQLLELPWQGIQISERSIISPRELVDHPLASKYNQKRCVFNVNSHSHTYTDYLDYDKDHQKGHKTLLTSSEKVVHELKQVPWIGKHVLVVQEASRMYFAVDEDIEERKIDLMNFKQLKELCNDIIVLDNQIIVSLEDCCLVFSQKDMMMHQIITKVAYTKPLSSFGQKGKQYVEHDKTMWCYSYQEEAKKIRETPFLKNFKKLKESITKLNFQINTLTPDKFVSPTGTTYLLMQITGQEKASLVVGPGESIQAAQSQLRREIIDMRSRLFSVKAKTTGMQVILFRKDIYLDESGEEIMEMTDRTNFKLTEDEQRFSAFCIKSDLFDVKAFKFFEFITTRNYLVINAMTDIYFIALDKIHNLDNENDGIPTNVNLTVIPITRMFDGEQSIKDSGVKIYCLQDEDFEIISQTKMRRNLFQISYAEELVMWDLDQNEEVSFLTGQSQFLSENDFVRTGFRLHLPIINKTVKQLPKIKDSIPVTTNWDQSIIGLQKKDQQGDLKVCLFRTFTMLDLYEMQKYQERVDLVKPVKHVDLNTVFANVYGRTIFSIFFDAPQVIQVVQKMIQNMRLAPVVDNKQIEFDNIVIRKLFRVILLPHMYATNTQESLVYKLHVMENWNYDIMRNVELTTKQKIATFFQKIAPNFHRYYINKGKSGTWEEAPHNLLQLSLNKNNQAQLDIYLDLVSFSREARFTNIIQEYGHFKRILNISSESAKNFLDNSFLQTEMCVAVDSLLWNIGDQVQIIGSRTCQLSEEEIRRKFEKIGQRGDKKLSFDFEKIIKQIARKLPNATTQLRKFCNVQVRVIEIEWLNENLRDFFVYLAKLQNVDLYENELIKVLLNQQDYSKQLILFGFIPFFVYMCLLQFYYTYILTGAIDTGIGGEGFFVGSQRDVAIRVMILIFTIIFLGIEIFQAIYLRFVYFADFWNYIYTGSFILNFVIICDHSMNLEVVTRSKLNLVKTASIASVILWFMLYYWMRLFQETSFYVLIIKETLKDIRPFLAIFVIIICCFANATLIIDQYGQFNPDSRQQVLIQPSIDRTAVDAWLAQYNLLLGNFQTGTYEQNSSARLLWIYFILATFFTNVMFLNMLIAIMSDTFTRITESKVKYSLQERTQLYADYIYAVKLNPKLTKYRYLYVITPTQDSQESGQSDWSGGISLLKKQIKLSSNSMETAMSLQTSTIRQEMNEMTDKVDVLQGSIEEIHDQLWRISLKLDAKSGQN